MQMYECARDKPGKQYAQDQTAHTTSRAQRTCPSSASLREPRIYQQYSNFVNKNRVQGLSKVDPSGSIGLKSRVGDNFKKPCVYVYFNCRVRKVELQCAKLL